MWLWLLVLELISGNLPFALPSMLVPSTCLSLFLITCEAWMLSACFWIITYSREFNSFSYCSLFLSFFKSSLFIAILSCFVWSIFYSWNFATWTFCYFSWCSIYFLLYCFILTSSYLICTAILSFFLLLYRIFLLSITF